MESGKLDLASEPSAAAPEEALDRLSNLLERFRLQATLFHEGALCGRTVFDARPHRAFLHVLRRGELVIEHPRGNGVGRRIELKEPSLIFYPRAVTHTFVNPPCEGSDFTCATLRFDGGDLHPIVAALPPLVIVPIAAVQGLEPALQLLFSETAHTRCGSRLLADRLFEVVLIQLIRWMMDNPEAVGVSSGLFMGMADKRLARVLVAVHQAPHEPWTVEDMAQLAHMSRSTFAEAFRKAVGRTPAAYLCDWRLTVAAALLRDGQAQKLVAAELGFNTASSLSRAFKQRFGQSPRAWVAAHR